MNESKIFGADISEMPLGAADHTNWLIYGTDMQLVQIMNFKLNENVVIDSLTAAVDAAMRRYPLLRCRIIQDENTFHYEMTGEKPVILCQPYESNVDITMEHSVFQWKVTYFENEITFYFAHGLFDGAGSIAVIKTILFYYAKSLGLEVENDGSIKTLDDDEYEVIPRETELPEISHYNPDENVPLKEKERVIPTPWAQGVISSSEQKKHTRIIINEAEFVKRMKELETSPFALVSVIMARAAQNLYAEENPNIPVYILTDLRGVFGADVMRNFIFTPAIDYISGKMNTLSMALCCTAFRSILDVKIQKENCNTSLKYLIDNTHTLMQMSIAEQQAIFEKNKKGPDEFSGLVLSYTGRMKLPQKIEDLIDDISIFITTTSPVLNEMISFKGKIYHNFIHSFETDQLFEEMVKIYEEQGITVKLEHSVKVPRCSV